MNQTVARNFLVVNSILSIGIPNAIVFLIYILIYNKKAKSNTIKLRAKNVVNSSDCSFFLLLKSFSFTNFI